MTEREMMLKKLCSYDFVLVELNLYLDTHPTDKQALEKLRQCEQSAAALRAEFEEKYGPLSSSSEITNPYSWINSPWPWEGGEE